MSSQTLRQWFRNRLMRRWYTLISRADVDDVLHFMNYGYAPVDVAASGGSAGSGDAVELAEAGHSERYPLQLYHHVASRSDLGGRRILEVGCGRGGGLSYLVRSHEPAEALDVDLNPFAVEFCRRTYPGIGFDVMDAQDLRFPDARFDAVINVESSHRYPDFRAFADEVFRVLRPGGVLLFADFRWSTAIGDLVRHLAEAGFETEHSDLPQHAAAETRTDFLMEFGQSDHRVLKNTRLRLCCRAS